MLLTSSNHYYQKRWLLNIDSMILRILTLIILITTLSCTLEPEPVPPTCDMVSWYRSGDRVRIQILDTTDTITMTHWGRSRTILPHYYHCISFAYSGPETVLFETDYSLCTIDIP